MAGRQFFLFFCILLAFPFSAKADENLVELVKKTKPCVVLIETFDKDNKPLGQGSGFFVNNKGHIVTNQHVLEGAYRATVKTSSGMEYPVEGIIAKNADADIVKLVVNITDANIIFLNLSENVPSEGQDIVVIGNPLGLESTVSAGIVSAVRDIPAFGKILQITAPISPGSSGSPVINSKGEVIGIATLIVTSGQNLNFAIPSDKIIALKETAQTPISDALATDSNDAQLFYQKGLKELWQENWSAALICFQKAKEKNPQDGDVWFYLGVCYDKLGRSQDEIESFKRAIRIKPDYAEAHYNLGVAYDKLGRYQDAMESYKQAIRIKPDLAEAYLNLGNAYDKLGRYQDEIEAYKQAIRIKPDYANAHLNLGLTYLLVGDKGSALEEYKILKTLDIERANKLFNLIYK
jgi:Flp pilus assembly protein TadD